MPVELVGLDDNTDGIGSDSILPHPAAHTFRQLPQISRHPLPVILPCNILCHGRLIGIALGFLPGSPDGGIADSVGSAPDMGAGLFSQGPFEDFRICPGGVTDRYDSQGVQAGCCRAAAAVQFPYGQGPHLPRHLVREQGMGPVRFLKVTGHLGQEFVGGNAHIDRESQAFPDLFPDSGGNLQNSLPLLFPGTGAARRACHVHIGFIDRDLFDHFRVFFQNGNELAGILFICFTVSGYQDQVRTFLQGLHHRFPGLYTVLFGRNGFGCDDPVPGLYIPSHGGRDCTQVQGLRILPQSFHGGPGQEGRVYVHMKYDSVHAVPSPPFCLPVSAQKAFLLTHSIT